MNHKIILTFLLSTLIVLGVEAQSTTTLSFRMNSPRVIRAMNWSGAGVYGDCLEFDIEVKGSNATSRLWAFDIRFTYDNTVVDTIDFDLGAYFITGPQSPYYNKTVTTNSNNLNIAVTSTKAFNATNGALFKTVPNTWTLVGTLRVSVKNPEGIPNIGFIASLMNGTQQEKILASPWTRIYLSPNLYDSKNLTSDYIGRIYSNTHGWTQVGGLTDDTPYLDWNTSVSTTVWDGSGEITQDDGVAALANNFVVESGATLSIPTNKWLTVYGNMTVNGTPANLLIASGASLIQNSANVNATVDRDISAWTGPSHGWHLLSSPVAGQVIAPAFTDPVPANYDFYKWGETRNLWLNQKLPENNIITFGTGIGYLVAYSASSTKQFTGVLNSNDISGINLTRTDTAYSGGNITPGWNLLGNPYSSAITWNTSGWSLPLVTSTAKIWNEANASYTDVAPGGVIPAMQGFMVETSGATTVTIPAAAKVHNILPWYKSSGNPYLKLLVSSSAEQTAQESIISVDGSSAPGFDPAFDSRFLPGYAPFFYTVDGTENLSTNVLREINGFTAIPLAFIKTSGTDYSIRAVELQNFSSDVYLNDLLADHTQELRENPVYDFTAAEGDDPARFLITFGPLTGKDEISKKATRIYACNQTLYLSNPGKSKLELFTLSGQKVLEMNVDGVGLIAKRLFVPTGFYIARLTGTKTVMVEKVFIRG